MHEILGHFYQTEGNVSAKFHEDCRPPHWGGGRLIGEWWLYPNSKYGHKVVAMVSATASQWQWNELRNGCIMVTFSVWPMIYWNGSVNVLCLVLRSINIISLIVSRINLWWGENGRSLGRPLLCMQGLLEGGFLHITTLWIILIQILSYHDLAFL